MIIHDESGDPITIDTNHTVLYTYSGTNMIYLGKAEPGSSGKTDQTIWQIRKYTYDGSNNLLKTEWADGNAKYDNIWDNRTTLTYT
jgi:YD repeat-containing protein